MSTVANEQSIKAPEERGMEAAAAPDTPLLDVRGLKTYFPIRRGLLKHTVGHLKAVDDVSFQIHCGETLGLVGESGCGKSTVGRSILRLIEATEGSVNFDGVDVFSADRNLLRTMRRQMQIIFQDPVGSLNPRMTVGRIIGEPITVHRLMPRSKIRERVALLLQKVGLLPQHAGRYPHEFSGGQRQRIGIARALALEPKFIVCDEPVSALDVSIQSQILNLLDQLQQDLGLSYLFIAHNLAVVEHFCDRVAVMYLGRLVETADRNTLYARPAHPYTRALISAAPHPDPNRHHKRIVMTGEVPSPKNPPHGCTFHPRCDLARHLAQHSPPNQTVAITVQNKPVRVMRRCVEEDPQLEPVEQNTGHCAACWFRNEGL